MKICDKNGNAISSLESWEKAVSSKHWKKGRSTYELADFMLHKNGEEKILDVLKHIVKEKATLEKATPEHEVMFDKYGSGRKHDLGIWGATESGKRIFIGLEAKVDEPFGGNIAEILIKADIKELGGDKTNAVKRLNGLLSRLFPDKEIGEEIFQLKYQLIYGAIGTIGEKSKNVSADISVMLLVVFKSGLYNDAKGKENLKDYKKFIKLTGGQKIALKDNAEIHKLNVSGKDLYSVLLTVGNH